MLAVSLKFVHQRLLRAQMQPLLTKTSRISLMLLYTTENLLPIVTPSQGPALSHSSQAGTASYECKLSSSPERVPKGADPPPSLREPPLYLGESVPPHSTTSPPQWTYLHLVVLCEGVIACGTNTDHSFMNRHWNDLEGGSCGGGRTPVPCWGIMEWWCPE